MKVLIKLGGTLLDHPEKLSDISRQLNWAAGQCDLVVVHGGGKQVTRYLEERGVHSTFVNGLRVSDEAVISAVTNVIAGGVNKQLVAALNAAGRPAVGVSGVDGKLVTAQQLSVELKFTGQPVSVDVRLLDLFISAGYVPVVACIAGDATGNIYNVNADQLAVCCATGWRVDKLFFLTDVPGVKDGQGEIIPQINSRQAEALIASGVASGGMQAKLQSCIQALQSGVSEVVIAPGQAAGICQDLLSGHTTGTRIILQEAPIS